MTVDVALLKIQGVKIRRENGSTSGVSSAGVQGEEGMDRWDTG